MSSISKSFNLNVEHLFYFQPEYDMFEDEKRDPDKEPDEMFRFVKVME